MCDRILQTDIHDYIMYVSLSSLVTSDSQRHTPVTNRMKIHPLYFLSASSTSVLTILIISQSFCNIKLFEMCQMSSQFSIQVDIAMICTRSVRHCFCFDVISSWSKMGKKQCHVVDNCRTR